MLSHTSKAFDTIDYSLLLSKLCKHGVRGTAYDWFQSYLQNRAEQVDCGEVLSSAKSILSGVPQGSILGPLLFLVYVNDFPNCLNIAQALMFADDTTILFPSNNYETLFNSTDKELSIVSN